MCKIFESFNLRITIDVNHKIVDFLDVNFNLETGLYQPFLKPNDSPIYINKDSNHPPSILRNLPASVNKRLSSISSNEGVFREAIPPYKNALRESGYNTELKFENEANNGGPNRRKRSRNITWFNPPYSMNVSTCIGSKFFENYRHLLPPFPHPTKNNQQKHYKGIVQVHAECDEYIVQT